MNVFVVYYQLDILSSFFICKETHLFYNYKCFFPIKIGEIPIFVCLLSKIFAFCLFI